MSLSKAQAAELEFGCPEPQEVFNVRLQRMIGKGTYLHLHVGALKGDKGVCRGHKTVVIVQSLFFIVDPGSFVGMGRN